MDYVLNTAQADEVLCALKKDYCVYAPKRFQKEGRYSDTDIVRYDEVELFRDIVWDVKSDYPAKEVLTPIQQTIFILRRMNTGKVKDHKTDSDTLCPALRYQCTAHSGQDICG